MAMFLDINLKNCLILNVDYLRFYTSLCPQLQAKFGPLIRVNLLGLQLGCSLQVADYCPTVPEQYKTTDSDTLSTYQVSSVQLVTDKKLEAFNNA